MPKILLLSTVSRQFHLFERSNIEILASMGYEVHAAANYSDANPRLDTLPIVRHDIPAERSPFSPRNLRALRAVLRIIRDEGITAIHCHSPVGGALGRVAGAIAGVRPVIYTAHGFHFHRGAPLLNWLVYYPVERALARWTDVLITINAEDYGRARRFPARRVVRIPGVGIDVPALAAAPKAARDRVRAELGIPGDAVLLLSVGELNANKNHQIVLQAMAACGDPRLRYAICGQGVLRERLLALAAGLGLQDRFQLLGYRDDIPAVLQAADIFVHPSLREGMPIALLEAMAAELPCVVSDIRGSAELVGDGRGGYRVPAGDLAALSSAVAALMDAKERRAAGERNRGFAGRYSTGAVAAVMGRVYGGVLTDDVQGGSIRLLAGAPHVSRSPAGEVQACHS